MTPRLPDLSTPVRTLARSDFVALQQAETIGEALERLRGQIVGERVIYFYVIDEERRLLGVVPVRRLLLSDPTTLVDSVMVRPVVSVRADETFENALRLILERRFLALPVVDERGRLEGVIDVAAFTRSIIDLEREPSDAIFQLAGIHIEEARRERLHGILRIRFPWLLANIASGLTAAALSMGFGYLLREVVALAFFVPLVLTIAESITTQSVTISLNRLQAPGHGGNLLAGLREVRAGSMLGFTASLIVGGVAMAWLQAWNVALSLVLGIIAGSALAAALGYLIPRLASRRRVNPVVASGPVALAITDVVALGAYYGLAALLLK